MAPPYMFRFGWPTRLPLEEEEYMAMLAIKTQMLAYTHPLLILPKV